MDEENKETNNKIFTMLEEYLTIDQDAFDAEVDEKCYAWKNNAGINMRIRRMMSLAVRECLHVHKEKVILTMKKNFVERQLLWVS